jgi:2-isopropylmalate synthase
MSSRAHGKGNLKVEILDTTLRDGSQQEGISLTVDDKLRIAQQLDRLGVAFIEGGWPGANLKDDEFFSRANKELKLRHAKLVAFGSTRRPGVRADKDPQLRNLLEAGTEYVCVVGKSWDVHVTDALQTSLNEGVAMVAETVAFLVRQGCKVIFDAEHFFDGFRGNAEYARRILAAAAEAGAYRLVLCDTNGGSLPNQVGEIVAEICSEFDGVGVHCHNDSGCAVANSLAAVMAGAVHVQGCVNGYGERTGNADLCAVIANLALKLGYEPIPRENLPILTAVAHHVAEIVNIVPSPQQPYVGNAAFAHKAGLHTSALKKRAGAYEHVDPKAVGNGSRYLVSEMSGRASIELKARECGVELDKAAVSQVLEELKRREYEGYHYEAADASLELLLRQAGGWRPSYFDVESFSVASRWLGVGGDAAEAKMETEATVKVHVGGQRIIMTREGNGPVNALDNALRAAIEPFYPQLARVHLADYKVRVLDSSKGTGAVTRVLVDSTDGERTWSTIGVSSNIIEASWLALLDAVNYGLLISEGPR